MPLNISSIIDTGTYKVYCASPKVFSKQVRPILDI